MASIDLAVHLKILAHLAFHSNFEKSNFYINWKLTEYFEIYVSSL